MRAAQRRGAAGGAPAALLLGDDEIDGTVSTDLEHVVVLAEIGVGAPVLNIGPVAAEIGEDRLAGFRVFGDLARQGQQPQSLVEIDVAGAESLGQR